MGGGSPPPLPAPNRPWGSGEDTSNYVRSMRPKPATRTELGPAGVSSCKGRVPSFYQLRMWEQVARMSVLPLQGPLPTLLGKRCHRQVSLSQGRSWIPAAPWAWTAEASPFHRCPPRACPPGGGAHLSGLTALALALRRGRDGPLVAVVGEGRHELRLTGCGEECILGLRSPLCVRDGPWDRASLCSPQRTVCVANEHPRGPRRAPPPTRGHATWKGLCQEPAPPSLGLEALCEAVP